MNSASYPKIFYPEVYILEGGYCGFYKSQPVCAVLRGVLSQLTGLVSLQPMRLYTNG
jgi:hypothetical protein